MGITKYERDRFFASICGKSEIEDGLFTRLFIFKKDGVFWIYCKCAITAYIFFPKDRESILFGTIPIN